ncbi:uncharacterized protein LOC119720038 [Patiria miniata]|uniref:Uncharacterized protein n=1 Tax=Patiria miniata TaxID=46514 RepID=A0A913Z0W9_PATMI|nr:uncharacterized protein LOC119720038 [Patiria miniata]
MRSVILLVALGALVACAWAENAEGKPKVDGSVSPSMQPHRKYHKENAKKKALADIIKIKMSAASEDVKRKELKHVFANLKRYDEKTNAQVSPNMEAINKEEISQTVKQFGKQVKNFNMNHKRKAGASLRRMSEEAAKGAAAQPRLRRAAPAKQGRTSFARAV